MSTHTGRPRSPRIDAAVRRAAREVLAAEGYAATSVERVSREAGVPKSAIYRRWSSRAELVFDAVVHPQAIAPPADTGSLDGDLTALARHVVGLLAEPDAARAMPGLLAEMAAEPERLARFRERWVEPERDVVAAVLQRAHARGEPVTTDVEDLHAQLLGTVFAWVHLVGDPPADLAARVTRALLSTVHHEETP